MRCKYPGLQLKLARPKNGEQVAGPSGSQIQDANEDESVAEAEDQPKGDDDVSE